MSQNSDKKSLFSSSEEVVSMLLGLVIVGVMSWIVFNFFQKRKGSIEIPGTSTEQQVVPTTVVTLGEKVEATEASLKGNIYEVKRGDSLWKISEKVYGSGYNWVDIARENKLKSPGVVEIGQKLNLPVSVAEIKVETVEYKVFKGDSLWKIAVKEYGDGFQWVKIWQANRKILVDPNKLEIGTKLIVPKVARVTK